jgi:F420-dependent oxidoreductase-like protein
MTTVPSPALIVLVGAAASGKTTWADAFVASVPGAAVVSSDRLRALVGEGEDDMRASADAFALLELAIARRSVRGLTTVIDTVGLDAALRAGFRALAAKHKLPCVAVCFDTAPALCRARNRGRDRVVPAGVLDQQLASYAKLRMHLDDEGFDQIIVVTDDSAPVRAVPAKFAAAAAMRAEQEARPVGLRFGLQIPVYTWPGGPAEIGERLRSTARAAEEAGFESIWVMDHVRQIPLFGPPWLDMLDCFTVLSHVAAVTDRVRVGPLVAGVTYRNVAQLGKMIASLDVLSGGRAVCGIGAAWYREEHDAYGWPFPPLTERYELLEDALQLLPMLWGKGAPAFAGRRISVPEAACYPRPLQEHVPILVGGSGERRTLKLVAQYADACNLFGEADVVRHKVGVLSEHCVLFDRDPSTIEVTQLSTTLVGRDSAETAGLIESLRPKKVTASTFAKRTNAATVEDQIGRFRGLADTGVQTAIVSLPDFDGTATAIERFAPIIAAFAE